MSEHPADVREPALADQLARADVKARLFGTPSESARVGRFAVLRRIGAGGMGVVYAAYDEELDRKVAIKLVRPGRNDPDIRARSRREAQALARLSHPNVVQVYEVGEYIGQVYLAMEYIQGQTLRAWQTAAARTWREVVAMYLQVGRGLAAAHACGLVHRDFKPDNVLVGDGDQRPRVLDFGLARVRFREPTVDLAALPPFSPLSDLSDRPAPSNLSEQPAPNPSERPTPPRDLSQKPAPLDPTEYASPAPHLSEQPAALDPTEYASPTPHLSEQPASPGLDSTEYASPVPAPPEQDAPLTVPGAVLGTPAYMAPEQLAGGEADARSDVFSFCVALYEALLRVRPFPGDRSDTLLAAVQRGELARPERPPDAPAWLLRVVERGLVADRTRRWPGMDPLLIALARDPTRWRRRLAVVTVSLALAAAAIYVLLDWRDRQQAVELAAEQARTAETEAELGRTRAVVDSERQTSEARRLAQSATQAAGADPTLQLLLAVEAVRVHRDSDAPETLEAAQALRDALGNLSSTPFRPPGPSSIVDAVAESPDGAWFATGQRNGAVTLWSTADPRSPHVLLAPGDHHVRALTFSQTRLAALLDERGGPYVWTLPTTPVFSDIQPVRWDIPVADLDGLAWSPDGAALLTRVGPVARLTSREHDDLLILRGPAPARVLRGHTAEIHHMQWSPDGGSILTAASDATARLWPPNGRKIVRTYKRPPSAVAFARDGRSYAVAADRAIDIFPVGPGPARRLHHAAPLLGLAFTADGDLVTAHSDWKLRQWDPTDGTSFSSEFLHLHEVLGGVRFSADADLLLGTPDGGGAYLWQRSRPGAPLILHGHSASVVTARFSADGRRALTGSADGSARRWHITDDPDLLRGHDAGIEHASFASDARRVVTASMDGTVRVWPRDGKPPTVLRGHREGSSVLAAFSPDGDRLATAGSDGLARLWALGAPVPTLLATLPADNDREAALVALEWHPRGDLLALAGDDGRVHLVHTSQDRPVRTDILTGPAGDTTLAFDPDTDRLIVASADRKLRVWRLAEPPVLSDTLEGHTDLVRAVALAGPHIVSAGDDTTVRIWSADNPPQVLQGHRGAISQIDVHPDGATLLTASADGTARVWPRTTDSVVLAGHTDAVWLAAWSPDGAAILTASADGTARLWSRRHGEWRATLLPQHGAPGSADSTLWTGGFSPDGRLALVAGADAIARIFPVSLADQLAAACTRAGADMSQDQWTRSMGDRPLRPTCP